VRHARLKKGLAVVVVILLVMATAVAGIYYRWSRAGLPRVDGEIVVAGLTAPVAVWRDTRGIPHLRAENEEDLFFAQGYVLAQDRLWQMDISRRVGRGEVAEIFGAEALDLDRRSRTLGYRRLCEQAFQTFDPSLQRILLAYARGVNAFIAAVGDRLPFEFRVLNYRPKPWEPVDSLVIGKVLAEWLSSTWRADWMRGFVLGGLDERVRQRLLPEFSPFDRPVVGTDRPTPPAGKERPTSLSRPSARSTAGLLAFSDLAVWTKAEDQARALLGLGAAPLGSNNWVLSGSRSETGKPLLANDPHLGHTNPSVWYALHLKCPTLHVAGVTLPGVPGVILGHNEHIAWGATNVYPDVQDLFIEEFHPDNPRLYRVGSRWQEADVFDEPIRVRASWLLTRTRTIVHRVVRTRHGPIIAEEQNKKLALRWTALDDANEFVAFAGIMRATGWDDFCRALRDFPGPMQNFVYADGAGNIGYYAAGRVPLRSEGDGSLPVDGARGEGEWIGYIPFEELPHLYNPPEGFIVTANQRIVGTSYGYHLTHLWYPPYRAARILELLGHKPRLSVEDVRLIQADVYSIPDALFAREVVKTAQTVLAGAGAGANERLWREILDELAPWDGQLRPESRAAALVTTMRTLFRQRILKAMLGNRWEKYEWANDSLLVDWLITERPREWLPSGYDSYEKLLEDCYLEALEELTRELGRDSRSWRYGRLNTLTFAHPLSRLRLLKWLLNSREIEMGGSANTVNAYGKQRLYGVSMRLIVDFSDLDQTRLQITLGQSGHHASPHFQDQLDDWLRVQPAPFPFSDAACDRATRHRLYLRPPIP
jgi:penicillin amidase